MLLQSWLEMADRTRVGAVRLVLALATFWFCLTPSAGFAQQVVGAVTELTGSVQLQRAAGSQTVVLATPIELHDQVATGPTSSVTVTLFDRSILALSESTTLVFDENVVAAGAPQVTVLRLLAGAVSSLVTARLGGTGFEVHTPNAITAVRGTDFDTTYIEGSARPGFGGCQRYTDVKVRDGVVAISNLANPGEVVEVSAGYETTVPCLLPPLNAGPLGIAGAAGPGARGGGRSSTGSAGGAAAAAVGFAAPPPGIGSAPPPASAPKVVQ